MATKSERPALLPLMTRVEATLHEKLAAAAAQEERPLASMVRLILRDWAEQRGGAQAA